MRSAPEGPSSVQRLLAALYYCAASMTVQFTNKALFTSYGFHFPLTVALLQMLVIAPVCYLVARPKLELALIKSTLPLAAVNVLNVVCGLIGTGGLNVPMFIALRRFTLMCTIILERVMMKKQHDRGTLGSVAVMIIGAMIAAASDLSFSLLGYAAVLGNDFLTALYLVMVKNTPATSGLTTTGLLFYNALLSLPLLAVALAISPEPQGIRIYPAKGNHGFQAVLVMSCALGLTINHSTFVCTRVNDPLLTSVAGNLKNVIMTIVGAFAFGDFKYHLVNAIGLGISMCGAIWYATKTALKATKKTAKDLLVTRDPSKQPLIGRDRSAALSRGGPPSTQSRNVKPAQQVQLQAQPHQQQQQQQQDVTPTHRKSDSL
ncbi:hypothetical protein WJX72_003877 [[Myrmecia] bisecta]|uniref:Sugar phosphate transporter domain-containing protein n=1 Tax=[Myrmecia] bisecta TaxID=41462 RepID=A0AAW1PJP0_9CHLO